MFAIHGQNKNEHPTQSGGKQGKWVLCTIYIGENGHNTHLVKQGIICYNVCWWDTPPMIYEEIH